MKTATISPPAKPLRKRPASSATREAFADRFGPKPGEKTRDLMSTLLRLRGKA